MGQDQIDHVINHSEWNEETKEWKIPYFTYKEKNMGLPKLQANTTSNFLPRESIEVEKDKKEITFKASIKNEEKSSSSTGFKVNNILKNAR